MWSEGLLGPKVNLREGRDGMLKMDATIPARYGEEKGADLRVTVVESGDNEISIDYECLCAACAVLGGGSEELEYALEYNVYGKPMPGDYYLQFWSETYRSYWEGEQFEYGLKLSDGIEET